MSASKLSVAELNAAYGLARVLFDVSLKIAAGEAVALLGRNGAGKSTLFRAILGLIGRRSGKVVFDGEDITNQPPYEIVRRGLGYVPEDRRIFSDLTVEENLLVGHAAPRCADLDAGAALRDLSELAGGAQARRRANLGR